MADAAVIAALVELRAAGTPGALATVVRTRGHAPREVGTKMLILRDGRCIGTIGGGCGEAEVKRAALNVIDSGQPLLYEVDLLDDPALPDGAVCGGKMAIFIECFA